MRMRTLNIRRAAIMKPVKILMSLMRQTRNLNDDSESSGPLPLYIFKLLT